LSLNIDKEFLFQYKKMHLNHLGAFFTLQTILKISKMLNNNQYYSSFEPLKRN